MKAGAASLLALAMLASAAASPGPVFVRRVRFAGYDWLVKSSRSPTGPGGNRFSDAAESVFVDADGELHLKLRKDGNRWYSAEVALDESLGYGDYLFELDSRIDDPDPSVVVGIFTWSDADDFAHREMDFEFSTWGGQLVGKNAQFVVQPPGPDTMRRFMIVQEGSASSHRLRWRPGSARFESRHGRPGEGRAFEDLEPMYVTKDEPGWICSGPAVPPAGDERVRINLYLYDGKPPSRGEEVELVVSGFSFIPAASF